MLLWLAEREGLAPGELADALEHDSGLLGLCGTADMREVLQRDDAGEERARLALEVYLHSLRAGIAAMIAALAGIDALVFTGGVGQRSARLRELATDGLGYLGIAIDAERNRAIDVDGEISAAPATVATLVLAAREDLEIARQVRTVLEPDDEGP